jgi:SAM-dependent methyltransferase
MVIAELLPSRERVVLRGVGDAWRLVRFLDAAEVTEEVRLSPETTREITLAEFSPDAVLAALGVRDDVEALDEHELAGLVGIVEGFLAQAADHVCHPARAAWNHETPSILMAQGHTSTLLGGIFARSLVPAFGAGLEDRLRAAGASFLDVGVGVAALAITMCRLWPQLRVVGVDPWQPALELARENVAAAGLQERIELRELTAEALTDAGEHDLAWIPTIFISDAALERAIERVHAALRPGGWAILGLYARPDDPLAAAVADLRTARHGGALGTPQDVAAMLSHAGFAGVDVVFEPKWRLPMVFVVGQRPERSQRALGGPR